MKKLLFYSLILLANICIGQKIERINSSEHLKKNYPFSEASIVNGIIYLSGEIGTLPNGKLIEGGIKAETNQTLMNIKNTLNRMGASMDDVFKCTCMLSDISEWAEMSAEYIKHFKKDKLPARSAFAGSGLALNAKLEIECMAYIN